MLADDPEDAPTKSNGSLLGRKGLGRRNSLQAERSRTVSAKKPSMAPTKSEGTIQNPNLTVGNKRLSLRDLPKSNTSNDHLMPPPRVPLGKHFEIIAVIRGKFIFQIVPSSWIEETQHAT